MGAPCGSVERTRQTSVSRRLDGGWTATDGDLEQARPAWRFEAVKLKPVNLCCSASEIAPSVPSSEMLGGACVNSGSKLDVSFGPPIDVDDAPGRQQDRGHVAGPARLGEGILRASAKAHVAARPHVLRFARARTTCP